jgi:hypothetical protein
VDRGGVGGEIRGSYPRMSLVVLSVELAEQRGTVRDSDVFKDSLLFRNILFDSHRSQAGYIYEGNNGQMPRFHLFAAAW